MKVVVVVVVCGSVGEAVVVTGDGEGGAGSGGDADFNVITLPINRQETRVPSYAPQCCAGVRGDFEKRQSGLPGHSGANNRGGAPV